MNCNRVAIPGIYLQGTGMIWNMEGFGSNGDVRPAISPYGTSKYAVRWLTPAKIQRRFLMNLFRKRDVFGPLGI